MPWWRYWKDNRGSGRLIELVDELQPTPEFRNLRVPTESIRIIADGVTAAGRIEWVGVERYRATGRIKSTFG